MASSTKRVLIYRLGSLGDTLIALPAFFRSAVRTRSPGDLLSLWWRLLRWRPEVLIYMGPARGVESARRDARFFRLCGISRLIGVPVTEDMQQNRWREQEQALEPE